MVQDSPLLIVASTVSELAVKVAKHVQELLLSAIESRGKAVILLSGGETLHSLYRRLSKTSSKEPFPWEKVEFYFADERCVPPDRKESNYQMVRETLFGKIELSDANVHRIDCSNNPVDCAEKYEVLVKQLPRIDVAILGLGEDGSTASLFPGSPVLHEKERYVRTTQAPDGLTCVTLTPRAFQKVDHLLFLVAGKSNSKALRELISPTSRNPLPAQLVFQAARNSVLAFDRAAGFHILEQETTH